MILIEPGPIRTEWGGGAYDSAQKFSGAGAYAGQVRAMKALYAQADRRGAEPSVIADVIREAVTAKRPKARYAAPFSAKAIIAALDPAPRPRIRRRHHALQSRLGR